MEVIEVIKEYAKANGYDGLVGNECGCSFEDLAPCGGDCSACSFGYVCPCETCEPEFKENCNAFNAGDFDDMVLPEKCEMRLRTEQRKADPVEEQK